MPLITKPLKVDLLISVATHIYIFLSPPTFLQAYFIVASYGNIGVKKNIRDVIYFASEYFRFVIFFPSSGHLFLVGWFPFYYVLSG